MYFWEFYRNHRSYYRNSPSFLKCSFKNTKNFGIIKLALRKRTIICCTPPFYPPKKLHEDEVIFVSRAFLTIPERQLHIHLYIYIHSFVNPASRNVFSWIRKRKRFNRNNRVATEWPVSLYSLQERVKQRGRKRSQDLWPQAKQVELTLGRRWRCPNDFFNDEMIAEVLSSQAEVIRGRALGWARIIIIIIIHRSITIFIVLLCYLIRGYFIFEINSYPNLFKRSFFFLFFFFWITNAE